MPKRSPLSYRDKMEEAIAHSSNHAQVLEYLGLRAAGGNFKQLKKWAQTHGLELPQTSGFDRTRKARMFNTRPDEEVFCENSTYVHRNLIKKRLREIWNDWTCASCGIGEEWNGKPLVLQLEHKNGIWNDNRLENLELLCPNCHSQTDTFAGKHIKRSKEYRCDCGVKISASSQSCRSCASSKYGTKWDEPNIVKNKVRQSGFSATGRHYGVDGNSVRKFLVKHGFDPKNL